MNHDIIEFEYYPYINRFFDKQGECINHIFQYLTSWQIDLILKSPNQVIELAGMRGQKICVVYIPGLCVTDADDMSYIYDGKDYYDHRPYRGV